MKNSARDFLCKKKNKKSKICAQKNFDLIKIGTKIVVFKVILNKNFLRQKL